MIFAPVIGVRAPARSRRRPPATRVLGRYAAPCLPKFPVRSTSNLCRYETSVECRFICTPRSSNRGHARGRRECAAPRCAPAPRARRSWTPWAATSSVAKCGSTCSRPSACSAKPLPLQEAPPERSRRPSPRAGTRHRLASPAGGCRRYRRSPCGGGSITIRQALRIVRDLAQREARARDAVREPRVLAQEQSHLAVLEVAARVAADHLRRDPELAGLLLRERARAGARTRAATASPARIRRAGDSPGRRLRSRRSIRRRARRGSPRSAPTTSWIAVSQSISSNVPSARRRSGLVRRCGPFW